MSVDLTFAEAGLDSLAAVEAVDVLSKELELSLGPTVLFDHPTPASLAAELIRLGREADAAGGGKPAGLELVLSSVQPRDREAWRPAVHVVHSSRRLPVGKPGTMGGQFRCCWASGWPS